MGLLMIVWLNLLIQLLVMLWCKRSLERMVPYSSSHILMMEGRSEGFHIDPLTEALTKLSEADKETKETLTGLDRRFVKREEFEPVQKVVYGMVGIILATAIVSLLLLISWKGK